MAIGFSRRPSIFAGKKNDEKVLGEEHRKKTIWNGVRLSRRFHGAAVKKANIKRPR